MNVTLNVHDVASIKKRMKIHAEFMCYCITAIDEKGNETEIVLYGAWGDTPISIGDMEIIDYREKD